MMKAPSSSAITTLGGMPSVSSGMKAPPAAALLAASGPATPSMAPLPNAPGRFEMRLLDGVGRERGDHRAAAGQHAEEEAQDRAAHDRPVARRSSPRGVGHRLPMRAETISRWMLLLEIGEDLGDAEQPHDDGHEADAVEQLQAVEGQARLRR